MSARHQLVRLLYPQETIPDSIHAQHLWDLYPVENCLDLIFERVHKIMTLVEREGVEDGPGLDFYLDVCELFKLVYPFNRIIMGTAGVTADFWRVNINDTADKWHVYEELFESDLRDIAWDFGQNTSDATTYIFIMSLSKFFFAAAKGATTLDGYGAHEYAEWVDGAEYRAYRVEDVIDDLNSFLVSWAARVK